MCKYFKNATTLWNKLLDLSSARCYSLLMEDQVLLEMVIFNSKQHNFKIWGFFPINARAALSRA